MTKHEAKALFGGTDAKLADALGLTRSAVTQWRDPLTQEQVDRVTGAAVRMGLWPRRSVLGPVAQTVSPGAEA
jgi:UTP--glucose-1-phosphate uridylyltransferase